MDHVLSDSVAKNERTAGLAGAGRAAPRWYRLAVLGGTLAALAGIALVAADYARAVQYNPRLWGWLPHVPSENLLPAAMHLLGAAVAVGVLLTVRYAPRRVLRLSDAWWLAAVVALAAGIRLACVLALPYWPGADFGVYHLAGVEMARRWELHVGWYRCLYPPGQVFSLGVLYSLFGEHFRNGQLLNVAHEALTVACVWRLATRWFGPLVGRTASLLAALLPSAVFGCMLLGAEVPETFWLLAALCAYDSWIERTDRLWGAAICGLCLGVGSLIRPTYVLAPAVFGLHLLLSRPGRRLRALATACVMAAGTAVVVLPWTARNYAVTGGFILISSNGGGNLYSANNDEARGDYTESAWFMLYREANNDDLKLQRLGSQLARDWIRHNPGRFLSLALRKARLLWERDTETAWWALEQPALERPDLALLPSWGRSAQALSNGYYLALIVGALAGCWKARRDLPARGAWMVVPVLCAYFTAVHMVFEAQSKYRFMLMPLICALAALAARRRGNVSPVPRPASS